MRLPPPANQELILNKKAYPPKTKEILRKKPVFAGLLCPFARTGGPQEVFPVQCMRLPPPANQELILNKKACPPKIKKEGAPSLFRDRLLLWRYRKRYIIAG
jgi:hypothetical protein